MSEEAMAQPEEAAPVTPTKEEIAKMAEQDRGVKVVDTEVEIPQPKGPVKSLAERMIDVLKADHRFKFVGASRIENLQDDEKLNSIVTNQILFQCMMKGITDKEEFKKIYCNGQLILIQAFAECPTMSADGMYNAVDVNKKPIMFQLVGGVSIAKDAEFQPSLICRTGPGLIGQPGTLGMCIGDPYRQITPNEAQAVATQLAGGEVKAEAPAAAPAEEAPKAE
jgi:hypothetical protein